MCAHTRSAARAARCTASRNPCHEALRQKRLQPPLAPEKHRSADAVAQVAAPGPRMLSDSITMGTRGGCAFAACSLEPPKLWIHIQDVTHKALAVAVIRSLATLMLDGAVISPQPVRVVPDGPLVDEIRYFKAGDRTGALAIIRALKGVLPRLWLRDLSAENHDAWVEHGHYELWVAPGDQMKDH